MAVSAPHAPTCSSYRLVRHAGARARANHHPHRCKRGRGARLTMCHLGPAGSAFRTSCGWVHMRASGQWCVGEVLPWCSADVVRCWGASKHSRADKLAGALHVHHAPTPPPQRGSNVHGGRVGLYTARLSSAAMQSRWRGGCVLHTRTDVFGCAWRLHPARASVAKWVMITPKSKRLHAHHCTRVGEVCGWDRVWLWGWSVCSLCPYALSSPCRARHGGGGGCGGGVRQHQHHT